MTQAEALIVYGPPLILTVGGGVVVWLNRAAARRRRPVTADAFVPLRGTSPFPSSPDPGRGGGIRPAEHEFKPQARPAGGDGDVKTLLKSWASVAAPMASPDPVISGEADIAQMNDMYGVSLRTLRFYEDKDLLHPRRQGTARFYSVRDRIRLELILKGKRLGFTLVEIYDLIAARERDAGLS